MRFKLDTVLHPLILIAFDAHKPLVFAFGDHRNTSVAIRERTPEETEKYKGDRLLMCTALAEEEPVGGVRVIFERLARNLMPEGFRKPKEGYVRSEKEGFGYSFDKIDDEGRIHEDHVPPAGIFPEEFQAFVSHVDQWLSECIGRTVRIIRWRHAMRSPHDPIHRKLGLSWAFADEPWRRMPGEPPRGFFTEFGVHRPFSPQAHAEIESLLRTEVYEPLGHALLLEAWYQAATNPRSALILGIAAAEVGFKECVGRLVPEAEWLVNNLPSPPVHRMVSEYLPLLPTKGKIQGTVLPPPKRIRRALEKGIKARNGTAHVGIEPPRLQELHELLLSVRDLLYLLDVYCGFDWAIDHIRREVREEMERELRSERGSRE